MSASEASRVLCTTGYEVEESVWNVSWILGISHYWWERKILFIDISTFWQYLSHHFLVVHLILTNQEAFDLCVQLTVPFEYPTSSIDSKESAKLHL